MSDLSGPVGRTYSRIINVRQLVSDLNASEKVSFDRSLSEAVFYSFKDLESLENAMPILVPPFPLLWMEMSPSDLFTRKVPREHQENADKYYESMARIAGAQPKIPERIGFLCFDRGKGFDAFLLWSFPDQPCCLSLLEASFHPDKVGFLEKRELGAFRTQAVTKDFTRYALPLVTDNPLSVLHHKAAGELDWGNDIVYLAGHMAMFHARNGVLREDKRQIVRTGTSPKLIKPRLRSYKTLSLILPTQEKGETGTDGERSSPSLHLVRGHFKAKKNGIYWWQPHWRGSTEQGVLLKEYRARKGEGPHV
jgi:hypothetical protein